MLPTPPEVVKSTSKKAAQGRKAKGAMVVKKLAVKKSEKKAPLAERAGKAKVPASLNAHDLAEASINAMGSDEDNEAQEGDSENKIENLTEKQLDDARVESSRWPKEDILLVISYYYCPDSYQHNWNNQSHTHEKVNALFTLVSNCIKC